MTPYYDQDGIVIYCGDAREVLPGLAENSVDAIVTDPPYGLAEKWTGGTWFTNGIYSTDKVLWDSEPPQDLIDHLILMKIPAVIWGGNFFRLPPSRGWLSWFKPSDLPTMAAFELAWTNQDKPARAFFCNRPLNRAHPTQKPIEIILGSIEFVGGNTILDPFMGSGTTLVAAKQLGRRAIGIEIEERYCEVAVKRLAQGALPLWGEK